MKKLAMLDGDPIAGGEATASVFEPRDGGFVPTGEKLTAHDVFNLGEAVGATDRVVIEWIQQNWVIVEIGFEEP